MAGEVRVGVDCGTAVTVAVVCGPDGRWWPLLFDGASFLSSAVWAGPDGSIVTGSAARWGAGSEPDGFDAQPLRRLADGAVWLSGREFDPVELVAATLRRVREEAVAAGAPVQGAVLVVPAGWGPRRRTFLRRAAHRAGLIDPTLVEAPVAVATHLAGSGLLVPAGGWVGVCDVGVGFEASVVRRAGDSFEVLAVLTADAGGHRLDTALAEQMAGVAAAAGGSGNGALNPGEREALLTAVRAAKEALPSVGAVTVPLPAPCPAVVLTGEAVQSAARPVLAEAVTTAVSAVRAADVEPQRCAGVFAVGAGAQLPGVTEALSAGLGMPVQAVAAPKLAAVLGAVQATAPAGDEPPAAPLPPVRRAVGVGVPAVLSLLLAGHFIDSAQLNVNRENLRYTYLLAGWGELAVAGLLALLAALAAAAVIASVVPPARQVERGGGGGGQQVAAGVLAATVAGLTVAGLYGLVGSVYFGMPAGPFLRWALLPSLPVAAAAFAAALLAMHRPGPAGGWHRLWTFPHTSMLLAAVGILGLRQVTAQPPAAVGSLPYEALVRLAGALVGVGIAVALIDSRWWRLVLAAPAALFCAVLADWTTIGILAVLYGLAAAVWWWRRVWRLARDTIPTIRPMIVHTGPRSSPVALPRQAGAGAGSRPEHSVEPDGRR
jgi:hypothetical protein